MVEIANDRPLFKTFGGDGVLCHSSSQSNQQKQDSCPFDVSRRAGAWKASLMPPPM
jgi:hypothetical protein